MQNISFNLPELLYGVVSTIVGVILWVLRRVSTNEKQIAVISTEIKNAADGREKQNKQTEKTLGELKSDVHELRDDIKILLSQNKIEH